MEVIARIGRIIGADFQRVHVQKFLAVRICIRARSLHGLGKPGAGVGGLRRYRRHRRAQRAFINSRRPINLRRHRRFQGRFGSNQRRQSGGGRLGCSGGGILRGRRRGQDARGCARLGEHLVSAGADGWHKPVAVERQGERAHHHGHHRSHTRRPPQPGAPQLVPPAAPDALVDGVLYRLGCPGERPI